MEQSAFKNLSKTLKWKLQYVILKAIVIFFQLFDLKKRYRYLQIFFFALVRCHLFPIHRIQKNIDRIYAHKSTQRRKKIILGNIKKTALGFSEYLELTRMDEAFLQKRLRFLPNQDSHRRILENKAGGLFIMGHLGLLEFYARAMYYCVGEKKRIYSLVRKTRNPYAEQFAQKIREKCGVGIMYNDQSVRGLIDFGKKGEIIAMPADQDAGHKGPFLNFLGHPASTYLGPAFVARKTDIPIYFYYCWHSANGTYCCAFEPIVRPSHSLLNANKHLWDLEFTKLWVSKLERAIRMHCCDYFWLHQRWRHQPSPSNSATGMLT